MTLDLTGLSVLIAAVGVVIVNIIVAWRTSNKVAVVDKKADVIAGHVNSAASASAAKIDGLQNELGLLRGMLAEKTTTAALMAQSAASTAAVTAAAPVVPIIATAINGVKKEP